MAEGRKIDPKILESIVSSLEQIKSTGTKLIPFEGENYTPDQVIDEIKKESEIGIKIYGMYVRNRQISQT